jgi:hypothetical protein
MFCPRSRAFHYRLASFAPDLRFTSSDAEWYPKPTVSCIIVYRQAHPRKKQGRFNGLGVHPIELLAAELDGESDGEFGEFEKMRGTETGAAIVTAYFVGLSLPSRYSSQFPPILFPLHPLLVSNYLGAAARI